MAVVQWVIGGIWYGVFGNVWLNLHAKTMTDIENPTSPLPYVIAFLSALVISYGLAWAIMRMDHRGAGCGFAVGMICWFAFLFADYATISVFSAFGTNPWPLILLNMGKSFLCFCVTGTVLGAWQKKVTAA